MTRISVISHVMVEESIMRYVLSVADPNVVFESFQVETELKENNEHIVDVHYLLTKPNPIKYLQLLISKLTIGGMLTIVSPNALNNFDKYRKLSTTGNFIDAYFFNNDTTSLGQKFESLSKHCNDNGNLHEFSFESFKHLVLGTSNLDNSINRNWCFSPKSLHTILIDLRDLGFLSDVMVSFLDGGLTEDFNVHLVKTLPIKYESKFDGRIGRL